MNQISASTDCERAHELRRATFELLEQHLHRGPEDSDPEVITALQDAANRLGAAEQSLRETVGPPRPEPIVAAPNDGPRLPISGDAAITLALAETLVPVAPSAADEAERWLRILREYGKVGDVLEQLGMSSGEFATPSAPRGDPDPHRPDPVQLVAQYAGHFARQRSAPAVGTIDLLFALILHYGTMFDRALYSATSKTRNEFLSELEQSDRVGR